VHGPVPTGADLRVATGDDLFTHADGRTRQAALAGSGERVAAHRVAQVARRMPDRPTPNPTFTSLR